MNKNMKSNGQSLVELALILPLLLLVVMGIFDLGRGIFYYSTIQNAAREGARYGAVHHCNWQGIEDTVQKHAYGLLDGLDVGNEISYIKYVNAKPEYVVVTVTYEFQAITPLIGNFLGDGTGSITLKSEARQLIELPTSCH